MMKCWFTDAQMQPNYSKFEILQMIIYDEAFA